MGARGWVVFVLLAAAGVSAGCVGTDFTRAEDPCPGSANALVTGTWGPGGLSSGFATESDYLWQPTSLAEGSGTLDVDACLPRLATLEAALTWENTPEASGDLALGVGSAPQEPSLVVDTTTETAPGEHRQELRLAAADLENAGLRGGTVYVGPASATGYYAPNGLEYTIDLRLGFEPAAQSGSGGGGFGGGPSGGSGGGGGGGGGFSVPGPGAPLMLLAAAAGVWVAARKV